MIRNLHHHIKWYLRDEFMIQEQVEPVPINLWQWGIKNRNGHLREMSHEIIMMNLMPKGNATVTFKGIRFKEMYYSCELAIQEMKYTDRRVNWVKRAEELALLQKHLAKLLKTKAVLEEMVKAAEDFQVRRVKYVADELRKRGELLRTWKIVRLARLQLGYYKRAVEEIQKEIEMNLSFGRHYPVRSLT